MFAEPAYYMDESTISGRPLNTIPRAPFIVGHPSFDHALEDRVFNVNSIEVIVQHFLFGVR